MLAMSLSVMWGYSQPDRGLARAGAPGPSPFSRATVSPVSSTFRPVPPLQLAPSHVSSLSLGLVGGFSSILRVSSRLAGSGRSFGARVCVGVESCSAKPCAPPGRAPRSLETELANIATCLLCQPFPPPFLWLHQLLVGPTRELLPRNQPRRQARMALARPTRLIKCRSS